MRLNSLETLMKIKLLILLLNIIQLKKNWKIIGFS